MTKTKAFLLVFLFLALSATAHAQATYHVFPQIADGHTGGFTFKSTIMIKPWFDDDALSCSLNFRGMSVIIEGLGSGSTFSLNFTANTFSILRTTGVQPLQTGYASLTCTDYVFAQVLYTYIAPNGVKIGEATVFSSEDNYESTLFFDQRDGAQLAIAIANDTDVARTYLVTVSGPFGSRSGTITIPARRNAAKFIYEIISNVPANAYGIAKIEYSGSFSVHYAMGLRFTNFGIFTTIPAN